VPPVLGEEVVEALDGLDPSSVGLGYEAKVRVDDLESVVDVRLAQQLDLLLNFICERLG
jgi:hypothetical protein